tara:strand:- start:30 stop:452 length:423 start_codon:yes stop_codon:yes gene_type:complete
MKSRFFATRKKCRCSLDTEEIWKVCIDAARYSLQHLGNAQSERAYEECMTNYLYQQKIPLRRQKPFYQEVGGETIPIGIADIEIDHCVIIELKAGVSRITREHQEQLTRYLRAADASKNSPYQGGVFLFSKDGALRIWKS